MEDLIMKLKKTLPSGTVITEYEFKNRLSVTANQETILSNGIDKSVVIAKLYNYEGVHVSDSDVNVTFRVGGAEQTIPMSNGQSSIEITSDVADSIVVSCHAPNMRSGEVTIYAE